MFIKFFLNSLNSTPFDWQLQSPTQYSSINRRDDLSWGWTSHTYSALYFDIPAMLAITVNFKRKSRNVFLGNIFYCRRNSPERPVLVEESSSGDFEARKVFDEYDLAQLTCTVTEDLLFKMLLQLLFF